MSEDLDPTHFGGGIILVVDQPWTDADAGHIEIYNGEGQYLGEVQIAHGGQVQELADAFAAEAEWVVVE